MIKTARLKAAMLTSACVAAITSAHAEEFNIAGGDLKSALTIYARQTGVSVIVSGDAVKGVHTRGAQGNLSADDALTRILSGTGFTVRRDPSGAMAIVRGQSAELAPEVSNIQIAQAAPARASVETVTVTSSKLGGADVQSIPIAITALSQEQLTSTQTAGGPDLVKQVPNLTFTKTNFTGYSIQIRGIGTQAISVATDPAVAVAFNDTPFIRNHFFEQEFYDLSQAEVLRGPQGTLYGRNATAGVVNITSAKPTDQFEAMASADIGNYKNRRFEGMINIPFVSDKLDLRIAGEWTKRDGYTYNETTGEQTDGRDLWSTRATLGWKPVSSVQSYLIWEHFSEDDNRLRSGKQLCKTDPGIGQFSTPNGLVNVDSPRQSVFDITSATFSQGCLPSSLYAPEAFGVPNGFSLPFISGAAFEGLINGQVDPYTDTKQSTDLHDIQSALQPRYLAKNDTVEWNTSWNVSPTLTFYSDTGYNRDFLWSTEDYNRFNTSPGIFLPSNGGHGLIDSNGVFCDPQLGCSDRLVVQDLATETSWQLNQEFRLASNFTGPLNFSAGGNYMHYETDEKYYVFSNTFTMISVDNICLNPRGGSVDTTFYCLANGETYFDPHNGGGIPTESPQYVDTNPITELDDQGHNYFLSNNPYVLNSYALFGEAYYNITNDLKLTGGLRWTDDRKHFTEIPSQLLTVGYGYPSTGSVDQSWSKFTGRAVANWTPKLSFTDQSLFYASYAHGYKAGGANPPGAVLLQYTDTIAFPVHPLTFKPEYVDAFEAGTKNTLLDGALTLNGDAFFYDYRGYQISQIVDRSAINLNFDATIKGAELEATWEPVPGLKFTFAGGYETTRINNGQQAIDLIDRTAGHPGWVVMKPFVGQSSNCIFPDYVAAALVVRYEGNEEGNAGPQACGIAYNAGLDPVTQDTYQNGVANNVYPLTLSRPGYPTIAYSGFDPATAPNDGEGFTKDLGGNELPNAPHYTVSLGADYTLPLSPDWAATLHGDFYWQAASWARVFNDDPYDRIRGYTNVNFALILTDTSGWQVMGYVKNAFDTTAITGDFLNSDDSGLTTNIFLTDPRLFGVRVTKHFDGSPSSPGYGLDFFGDADGRSPQIWFQLGGNFTILDADTQPYQSMFAAGTPSLRTDLPSIADVEKAPGGVFDWQGSATLQPAGTDWVLKAGVRYGRSSVTKHYHESLPAQTKASRQFFPGGPAIPCSIDNPPFQYSGACHAIFKTFSDAQGVAREDHMMLDFTLGKDVGLGSFGDHGKSTIAAGVRMVRFDTDIKSAFNSDPLYAFDKAYFAKYHYLDTATNEEHHSFNGIGPEVTWDGSAPILGNEEDGEITLDYGVNAAVLFGRKKASGSGEVQTTYCGYGTLSSCENVHQTPHSFSRSKNVAVPNLGGYLGASAVYRNSKISFGYRADTFFGAMDGGQDTEKSYNRGFYGPYLNITLGLGG
ncbi:MAG TPA: TonB-dependent receptor [Rhizomicrobium sp.]|nr:TonB-dependent receptor [Rhizomicrobium sp.]